jgi:hypothetical protein
MLRIFHLLVSVVAIIGGGLLLPVLARAQDLSTCSGNYNYCVELAWRGGQTIAHCEAAYQQCMGTGTSTDYYNPRNYRQTPVERN